MRYVTLDFETTGLYPERGDRVVEVGAVEIVGRKPGKCFHRFVNPERPIPEEVVRIHGITDEKVKHAPRFCEIVDELLAFLDGATLVIHNASFDLQFLQAELARAGRPFPENAPVVDTLDHARRKHPGERNSLDALCDRYGIDRSARTLHGALLDARLLAEVFVAMTGGSQLTLISEVRAMPARNFVRLSRTHARVQEQVETAKQMQRKIIEPDPEELAAHEAMLAYMEKISGRTPIWRKWEAGDAA